MEKIKKIISFKKKKSSKSTQKINKIKLTIWIFAILCIIALFFSISMLFTSATIVIKPRIEPVTVSDKIYTAKLKTNSAQDLPFEVISISESSYQTVEATGEKHAEVKAAGSVTIFNSYNSSDQKLATSTRLALSNGRIYRLDEAITVPGIKKNNGKDIPGSVTANITADKAGDSYNIKASDLTESFKIVSFKGTPKYNTFSATLNTDLTGGFIGQRKTITPEKEQEMTSTLKSDLQKTVLADLKSKKPATYLSQDNLNYIDYSSLSEEDDGGNVKVGMQADLNSIIFSDKKLAYYLAKNELPDFNELSVDLIPNDLTINIVSTSTTPWLEKSIDISLNGTPSIKWNYDTDKIKADLVGKSSTDLSDIKNKYSGSISDIKVHFNPFWQIFFPDDISKISSEEEN